ncbi:hypothetical protein [Kribbella solani]|uniref:Uncharacterized protein n=1 Tax=Kribbella solani TaxID=236067 RepID=A0A841DHN7_9ACTN|nr:hypothetical protein [Kribbella solani]MBB5978002.1 hypothetical protein [Kribbella solani]MDX2970794.1 hypothetical protein [Kribbella solani]MDX3006808.1 hypothetical protein [Kribbella solani]
MATDEVRKDLRAAVAARQELGPEYEDEIIDSFLAKLDQRDVHRRAGLLPEAMPDRPDQPVRRPMSRETDPGGLALAIVSIVAAIPITAISASMMGKFGVLICWAGLVGINYARAIARRR